VAELAVLSSVPDLLAHLDHDKLVARCRSWRQRLQRLSFTASVLHGPIPSSVTYSPAPWRSHPRSARPDVAGGGRTGPPRARRPAPPAWGRKGRGIPSAAAACFPSAKLLLSADENAATPVIAMSSPAPSVAHLPSAPCEG
jgi:hypothetical protein